MVAVNVAAVLLSFAFYFLKTSCYASSELSVKYASCKGAAVDDGIYDVYPTSSRLTCAKECAKQASCRAVTVCKEAASDVTYCMLSTSSLRSCDVGLTLREGCRSVFMVDTCENGGLYNKWTSSCDCQFGFTGSSCQTAPTTPSTTTTPPKTTAQATTTTTTPKLLIMIGPCAAGSTACAGATIVQTHNTIPYCCPLPRQYGTVFIETIVGTATCTCF